MVINEPPVSESELLEAQHSPLRGAMAERAKAAEGFIVALSTALDASGESERVVDAPAGIYELDFFPEWPEGYSITPLRMVTFTLWWDSGWKYKTFTAKEVFRPLGRTEDLPHLGSCVKEILELSGVKA